MSEPVRVCVTEETTGFAGQLLAGNESLAIAAERLVRAVAGQGRPLSPSVRAQAERAAGADLGAVRVHTGADAARLASLLGADAVTAGTDIFFGRGQYRPETPTGLSLLGHEVGHVVGSAPARGPARAGARVDDAVDSERAADIVAAQIVAGQTATQAARCPAPRPLTREDEVVLRCHASWEHRLLGDAPAADLNAIAKRLPSRLDLLRQLRDFFWMWHQNPEAVTQEMINARYPYIRTLRLAGSGLLVTYGELNTLPDYLADPVAMEQLPPRILLPILQAVRQECYNRVQQLLGGPTTTFAGSIAINSGWSFIDLLWETRAIDELTAGVGPRGTDHYTGLVGRNACHFAPYSWYRWQAFYTIAADYAAQAYKASGPDKGSLTQRAWVYHGYADHFLEDSFAAGHLVNKTLIMQWFIEWVQDKWYVPVADWGMVKYMTAARQRSLAAPDLYNMANPGGVRDPQTAEEQPSVQQRMATCGVTADGGISQQQGYLNYLAFLNSTVVQSSSGALHDYFNQRSVWAASAAHGDRFQLWGDDTMLNGGDGVELAGEAAHRSQQSIADILARGSSTISAQEILDRFPTRVATGQGDPLLPLQDWNLSQRAVAFEQFPAVHYYLLRAYPRIGDISVDQPAVQIPLQVGGQERDLVVPVPPSASSVA